MTSKVGKTRGVYLSNEEWELLEELGEKYHVSRNLLVRIATRHLLGLETPGVTLRGSLPSKLDKLLTDRN